MNWQDLSDRELVELCLQGKEDTWGEFLRRYHRLIASVIARTLRGGGVSPSVGLVEELAQESHAKICANDCRAFRELEWRHDGALRGLLQMIASSVAQDHLRKLRAMKRDSKKEVSLETPGLVVPDKKESADRVEQKILVDQLMRCLERVIHNEPDCTRDLTIFRLFYSYRITAADLSRVYKMDVRKVENTAVRLSRLVRSHCL